MRIAAIYDVHGNLPALDAVLQEIEHEHPDLILVGGDAVVGPMPRATPERLIGLGNEHDSFVATASGNSSPLLNAGQAERRSAAPAPGGLYWVQYQQ